MKPREIIEALAEHACQCGIVQVVVKFGKDEEVRTSYRRADGQFFNQLMIENLFKLAAMRAMDLTEVVVDRYTFDAFKISVKAKMDMVEPGSDEQFDNAEELTFAGVVKVTPYKEDLSIAQKNEQNRLSSLESQQLKHAAETMQKIAHSQWTIQQAAFKNR